MVIMSMTLEMVVVEGIVCGLDGMNTTLGWWAREVVAGNERGGRDVSGATVDHARRFSKVSESKTSLAGGAE
jgi:hypothetical protein